MNDIFGWKYTQLFKTTQPQNYNIIGQITLTQNF